MSEFVEAISKAFSLTDWLFSGGVLAAFVVTIVQAASKKYKPWTWIAKQFGKAANEDVIQAVKTVEKRMDEIEKVNKQQDEKLEEDRAKSARRRILQFADEIRVGQSHSRELFDNVLEDITAYSQYCDNNPGFKNEKAKASIEIIEDNYKKRIEKNDFL